MPVSGVPPTFVAVSVNVSGPSYTAGLSLVIFVRTRSVEPPVGIATNEPVA